MNAEILWWSCCQIRGEKRGKKVGHILREVERGETGCAAPTSGGSADARGMSGSSTSLKKGREIAIQNRELTENERKKSHTLPQPKKTPLLAERVNGSLYLAETYAITNNPGRKKARRRDFHGGHKGKKNEAWREGKNFNHYKHIWAPELCSTKRIVEKKRTKEVQSQEIT